MRNGLLRRIAATVVAAGLVFINCTAAMAAESLTDGKVGSNAGTALEKTITITKDLVAYNPEDLAVAAPEISYTYTLTAGTADKQVKDNTTPIPATAFTKAGVLPTTTTATVTWANTEDLTTAIAGASNEKTFSFDFSTANYTAAGIYRYVITETTTPATKAAAGVTDGGQVKYLDVYVKEPGAGESGFQIYGYVMFGADNDIDGTDASSVTAAAKTSKFVDQYYTYNLTVSKTLVNDTAMATNQFPFKVDFTNDAVTGNVLLKQNPSGTCTANPLAAGAMSGLDITEENLKIAGGASVKYIGIPAGTSAAVYEINNVTGTTYTSVYSIDGGAADGSKNITWDSAGDANKSNVASITTTANAAENAHTIAYTNTLTLISPTGLAFRYAPYALLIFAAVLLMMVMNRRREDAKA